MRKFARLALLAIAVLALGSCVLPNTGTIHVKNRLSGDRNITELYIYPTAFPDTDNEISSPLAYNDTYDEIGLDPGDYTIKSIIEGGGSVIDTKTVEDGVYHIVWVSD